MKRKKKTPRTFRFGKYKGKPVNEIIERDPDYCLWLHDHFDTAVFTDKEIGHLNHVWTRRHGTHAVLTVAIAGATIYEGAVQTLAGRRLDNISTTDLKRITGAEPAYAEKARMVVKSRREVRAWREMERAWLHKPAPVFQTDDIYD